LGWGMFAIKKKSRAKKSGVVWSIPPRPPPNILLVLSFGGSTSDHMTQTKTHLKERLNAWCTHLG